MSAICVTGHRPDKLGGYDKDSVRKVELCALKALEQLKPTFVVTGMALGWDTAIAKAAIELSIPFVAALPFPGQECKWIESSQKEYRDLLTKAQHIEVVNPPPYRPFKMQERNVWMIDHSIEVLALWNGDHFGGTFNAVKYAMVCSKPIKNAWGIFTGQCEYLTTVTTL